MEALEEPISSIVEAVHSVLERTPPELASDISDRGIVMTGGGSLIYGLDKLLQEKTGINVIIADDAISCVALGTGKALDNIEIIEQSAMAENRSNRR
jgi:rod shape-determining protein MreB and related proteins